jgi:multidrug efflux pump subunit AcrA (membrane-fusion protein)
MSHSVLGQQRGGGSGGSATDSRRLTTVFVEPIIIHDLYHRSIYGARIEPVYRYAHLSPVAGIIRNIYVKPGEQVRTGQLLYTIQQVAVAQNYLPTPVYALNSGVVVSINASLGDRLAVNVDVVTLASTQQVKINFYASEQDARRLAVGDTIYLSSRIEQATSTIERALAAKGRSSDVEFIARQDVIIAEQEEVIRKSQGVISAIPLVPNYQTGLFNIEAIFDHSGDLFFGKFERVELRVNRTQSLAVNQSLLINRYGRSHLAMVDENNVVIYREIELGETFGELVQILAGVQLGDEVIIRSAGRYALGENVEISRGSQARP